MDKEILTFGNIEIEKNKFYRNNTSIFQMMQILRKYSIYLFLVKKTRSTLLVTYIMMIKLSH